MTDLPQTSTIRRGPSVPHSQVSTGQTLPNQVVGWILIALVCLAPLPFGSVRPFYWALSAFLIGLSAIGYALSLSIRGERLRFPLRTLALPAALLGLLCSFMVLQLIPFGGFALHTAAGQTIYSDRMSIAPGTTTLTLLAMVSYGVLFFLLIQVGANTRRRERLLNVLLAMIVCYAIYALASLQLGDTILGLQKWAYQGSATGPFINRNSFATFLAFGALIAAAQVGNLIIRRSGRHPDDGHIPHNLSSIVVNSMAYLLLLITILSTQSRMGLLSMAVGTILIIAVTIRWTRRFRPILSAALGVLIAGTVIFTIYGQSLLDRLGSVGNDREVRLDLYAQVFELIKQRPLFGVGGGNFSTAFPMVHRPPVSTDLVWDRAHNSYLTLWSELGLVAGSIPIIILALFAIAFVRSVWRSRSKMLESTIGLAVIVDAGLHSLVDFSLEIHANALLFVAIIALAMGGVMRVDARS